MDMRKEIKLSDLFKRKPKDDGEMETPDARRSRPRRSRAGSR